MFWLTIKNQTLKTQSLFYSIGKNIGLAASNLRNKTKIHIRIFKWQVLSFPYFFFFRASNLLDHFFKYFFFVTHDLASYSKLSLEASRKYSSSLINLAKINHYLLATASVTKKKFYKPDTWWGRRSRCCRRHPVNPKQIVSRRNQQRPNRHLQIFCRWAREWDRTIARFVFGG